MRGTAKPEVETVHLPSTVGRPVPPTKQPFHESLGPLLLAFALSQSLQITPCDPEAPFTPLATRRYFRISHVGNIRSHHRERRRTKPRTRAAAASGEASEEENSSCLSDEEPEDLGQWKLRFGKVESGEEEEWTGRSAMKGSRQRWRERQRSSEEDGFGTRTPRTPSPPEVVRVTAPDQSTSEPVPDATAGTSTPLMLGGLAPASPNLSPYPSAHPSPALSPSPDPSPPSPPPSDLSLPFHPADDPCKRVRLSEPLATKASLVALRKTFLYATSPAVFLRHASLGVAGGQADEPEESSSEEELEEEAEVAEEVEDEADGQTAGDGGKSVPNGADESEWTDSPVPRRSTRTSQRASSPRIHSPGRRSSLARSRPKAHAGPRHVAPQPPAAPAPPPKIYKRTPPSSRSDRRKFLEAQAREAAAAASAAAVMMRMNGRNGRPGFRAGIDGDAASPRQAKVSRQTGVDGAGGESTAVRTGRPMEQKARGDVQIAPRGSSLNAPPDSAPPPYEEAVREKAKDELHPAEIQVDGTSKAGEAAAGEPQKADKSRRNGYLAGLASASDSLHEAFDSAPKAGSQDADAFQDAEETLSRTKSTAAPGPSLKPSPSPPRSPSPPPTSMASPLSTPQNHPVASLRSRSVHRLASPVARPSTPDVLMHRAAASVAQEAARRTPSSPAPVARKPSPLSATPEVPRRGSSAGVTLDPSPTPLSGPDATEKGGPVAMVGLHVETPHPGSVKEASVSSPLREGPMTRSASNRAISDSMGRQSSSSRRIRQAGTSTTPSATPSPMPSPPIAPIGRPRVLSDGSDQRLDTRDHGRRKRSIGSASAGLEGPGVGVIMTRSMSGTVIAS